MIASVRIVRFKRFGDQSFDLIGDPIVLAGPNNSGKTTLLHALAAWNLALKRWRDERGDAGGKKRIGLVLDEFTALPLREMNLLWLNRHTAVRQAGKKQPIQAPIFVQVIPMNAPEGLTIEFLYAGEKLVYVRPVKSPEDAQPVERIPEFAKNLQFVHVPAFSGIGTQEPRHAAGMQNKLIGEGKAGEVVRNLLLDIWERSDRSEQGSPWKELNDDIERLFQCHLLPPSFSAVRPYIVCEYRPKPNPRDPNRSPRLDIANAGSGFHQVLLLLSFFYARPASVLLLDEPDAHLHFILQREIFDHLRNVARRRGVKLIIATHSEVLLDESEPGNIISFIGQTPKRLADPAEKQRLGEALRRLSSLDLLQADHVGAVLYVEDYTDQKILREWARVLHHDSLRFLSFPYVVPLGGRGNVDEARRHFGALRLAKSGIKGLLILDRNSSASPSPGLPAGLHLHVWGRYEIENYLLNPEILKRYVRFNEDLFSDKDVRLIDEEFAKNFPPNVDYLGEIPAIKDIKASDFIVDVMLRTSKDVEKRDLYMLASLMNPDEIHRDVKSALDALVAICPVMPPNIEANVTPLDSEGSEEEASPPQE